MLTRCADPKAAAHPVGICERAGVLDARARGACWRFGRLRNFLQVEAMPRFVGAPAPDQVHEFLMAPDLDGLPRPNVNGTAQLPCYGHVWFQLHHPALALFVHCEETSLHDSTTEVARRRVVVVTGAYPGC